MDEAAEYHADGNTQIPKNQKPNVFSVTQILICNGGWAREEFRNFKLDRGE